MRTLALLGILLLAGGAQALPAAPLQRWVNADDVRARSQPGHGKFGAALLRGTMVNLVGLYELDGFCAVETDAGHGYVACSVLDDKPVIPADVVGVRRIESDPFPYDHALRVFWPEPSWSNLEEYARNLVERYPDSPNPTPYPRNEALEKMKADLALGIHGPRPAPYVDWADLKRQAVQHGQMSKQTRRLALQGKTDSQALQARAERAQQIMVNMRDALGLWGTLHNTGDSVGERRLLAVVDALEFSRVGPSLFRSEAQIAPPGASAEQASGRFGIVYQQTVAARRTDSTPTPGAEPDDESVHMQGLYDMRSRTDALVRPVQRVQLMRDGRLHSEASVLRKTVRFWDEDAPMCWDWTYGFTFGDADAALWRSAGGDVEDKKKIDARPTAGLFAFYTTLALALAPGPAAVRKTTVKLDRARTGFIGGTHLYFDLDADGMADLAVWEGQGKADGDLGAVTITDDRWYRLMLVNINGAWKVLGNDSFSYGCGC
ncbi:hypothetical protein F2P45_21485 [Massilia sp. CCM 8733]|uniref:SH3 domain-containing protein n=1 Tax=Massilia mucilaginosa TaxID=2609282 RepID=A0ABX0NXP9_9BURK|nr:hypothetical protein [Massilia mucilaginosa]NHZ91559.1 hypothetical protein [Massilia mucilaginosa]